MRFSYKTMLASLFATLALGALASASASAALPEFEGPITTEKPLVFEVLVGTTTFESKSGFKIECETGSTLGTFTSVKAGTANHLTFTGCRENGSLCNTAGAKGGELKTESNLPVLLVYIKKATKEVGIVFNYYEHPKKPFPPQPKFIAKFTCAGGLFEAGPITGSVVAPVTPINTKAKTFQLEFSGGLGVQKPSEYENEKGEKETDGFSWTNFKHESESMSFTAKGPLFTGKETVIKA